MTARSIWNELQIIRAAFHILLFKTSPARAVIAKDIDQWLCVTRQAEKMSWPRWRALVWFVWKYPEFRNVFYYRIRKHQSLFSRFCLELAKLAYRPVETLYIWTQDIGPGLFIQHGFSTIIFAKSIGENCWINQQVTIGFSNTTDCPIIGDNVEIHPGAQVFGNIVIGNNSKIGANAVVNKNVPANCTVVGVPAYIVRRDGQRVTEPLR